jgi:hypothetical protein
MAGSTTRISAKSKWDTVHPGRNRTYGADSHDRDELTEVVREHIAGQLASCGDAPWH